MRALCKKKLMFFFGNARPKSNERAHLKQRKKHSGLMPEERFVSTAILVSTTFHNYCWGRIVYFKAHCDFPPILF